MFRIAVAVAFTGAIVLASGDADARARFRMSSPSSQAGRGGAGRKAGGRPGAKARRDGAAEAVRRRTARQSAAGRRRHVRGDRRPRPAGAAPGQGAPQRALGDDSSGPLQFDPTLAAADDKAAEPKKQPLPRPRPNASRWPKPGGPGLSKAPAKLARRQRALVAKNNRSPPASRRRPSLRRRAPIRRSCRSSRSGRPRRSWPPSATCSATAVACRRSDASLLADGYRGPRLPEASAAPHGAIRSGDTPT